MANILQLSDVSRGTNVDLLTGTLKLRDRTWQPRTAPIKGKYKHTPFGAQPEFDHYAVVTDQLDLVGSDTPAHLRDDHLAL